MSQSSDDDAARARDMLSQFSKHCPVCNSIQITSDNSTPLNHRCLDCNHTWTEKLEERPFRRKSHRYVDADGNAI